MPPNLPDDRNNTQASTLYEDGSVLWQIEAGPPSYEEIHHIPSTSGNEAMKIVLDPPCRISTQQDRPEIATFTKIRSHTRQLTQQLDNHIPAAKAATEAIRLKQLREVTQKPPMGIPARMKLAISKRRRGIGSWS